MVFGVPVIIGGGIVYAIYGNMIPVFIYQAILAVLAGAIVSK